MSKENKKALIMAAAKKFLEDNSLVSQYLRGEATKEQLESRGVKLAMPLKN